MCILLHLQVWFQNRRSKERRLKHLCNFLRHYDNQQQHKQCMGIDDIVSKKSTIHFSKLEHDEISAYYGINFHGWF